MRHCRAATSTKELASAALVSLLLVLAACSAPQQSSTAAPSKAAPTTSLAARSGQVASSGAASVSKEAAKDWRADWERTLADARREGRVVVVGQPGEVYREALTAFRVVHPDVPIEYSGLTGPDFMTKVMAERQGGQFLWDIFVGGGAIGFRLLSPGALDPIRNSLVRPEISDDTKWLGGFNNGFVDTQRERIYATMSYLSQGIFVNQEVIPAGRVTKLSDLLDATYKDRIAMDDPRAGTTGSIWAALVKQALGEDGLRRFLTQQGVVYTRDRRQLAEWVVRGKYPIGLAVDQGELADFQRQGVGLNTKPLASDDSTIVSSWLSIMVMNRAPHPNAAKVYLDWFLSQDGQAAWNKVAKPYNSRRLDVEPADRALLPKSGVNYFTLDREEVQDLRLRAQQIANQLLP